MRLASGRCSGGESCRLSLSCWWAMFGVGWEADAGSGEATPRAVSCVVRLDRWVGGAAPLFVEM
eukprot:scaffold111058_cov37-Tisochrysis_lutea.AAC.1